MADFGIARHRLINKNGEPARTRNSWWVTEEFDGMPTDDVYLMGQLLAYLLFGVPDAPISIDMIAEIKCSDKTKEILHRAIGPRNKRYADAFEMLEAFRKRADVPEDQVRSLKNKCVVFTGPLSIARLDAAVLVLQAGGRVGREVTSATDVVVVGRRGNYWICEKCC